MPNVQFFSIFFFWWGIKTNISRAFFFFCWVNFQFFDFSWMWNDPEACWGAHIKLLQPAFGLNCCLRNSGQLNKYIEKKKVKTNHPHGWLGQRFLHICQTLLVDYLLTYYCNVYQKVLMYWYIKANSKCWDRLSQLEKRNKQHMCVCVFGRHFPKWGTEGRLGAVAWRSHQKSMGPVKTRTSEERIYVWPVFTQIQSAALKILHFSLVQNFKGYASLTPKNSVEFINVFLG